MAAGAVHGSVHDLYTTLDHTPLITPNYPPKPHVYYLYHLYYLYYLVSISTISTGIVQDAPFDAWMHSIDENSSVSTSPTWKASVAAFWMSAGRSWVVWLVGRRVALASTGRGCRNSSNRHLSLNVQTCCSRCVLCCFGGSGCIFLGRGWTCFGCGGWTCFVGGWWEGQLQLYVCAWLPMNHVTQNITSMKTYAYTPHPHHHHGQHHHQQQHKPPNTHRGWSSNFSMKRR